MTDHNPYDAFTALWHAYEIGYRSAEEAGSCPFREYEAALCEAWRRGYEAAYVEKHKKWIGS